MAENDQQLARILGRMTGALVASQLATAMLANRAEPSAEEAVQAYHEVLAELRKATVANRAEADEAG